MEHHLLPGPLRLTPAYPFAGRARELATLDALLPRAVGEGRRVAFVSGEPGSGKSRLVRELAEKLAGDGAHVLYGGCDAVLRTPYGAFVEALADLVRDVDPEGSELSRLLPARWDSERTSSTSAAADADAERHRLHLAVADLLTTAGSRAPTLLLLEDLHWADGPTLLLLRHLVRSAAGSRMLLVGTFRDGEADMPAALAEALPELSRSEGVTRMRLAGLDDHDVSEFLRLATGAEPDPDVTAELVALTAGNAFLLTELWRELVESDALEISAERVRQVEPLGDIATPETVREVVAQRIARLQPGAAEVLELGAVAGSAFELNTVRRASALSEGELLDAVDQAVRSGLLVEAPGRGLAYRFAHELVRRSVIDRVSAARRAELHLRIAQALESLPAGTEPAGRLAALAYHYTEAAPIGGQERAISYIISAAESAAASLAFDEAAGLLQTALQLGVDDLRQRGDIDLELGYACHRGGRPLDALAAFRDAASVARALEDVGLLARAAIGFEEACWRPAIVDEGAVELLEEAVAAVGPEPSGLRVRLLGALTRALDFRGDYPRARPARDEATSMARALGDRAALGWVLSSGYWSRGARPDVEVNAMLVEALAIGEEVGDDEIRAEALWWLVPSHISLLDPDAAHAALAELFELGRRLGEPFRLHVAEHYAAALALSEGDLAEAEAAAHRSHEWSRLLRGRDASSVHGIQMFGIRREQGRLTELAPAVRVLAARGRAGSWSPALAVLLADLGMVDDASRELDRIRAEGLGAVGRTLWLASLAYVTEAAVSVGDAAMAPELYSAFEPHRGLSVQIGHLVAFLGAADRYLGMLATQLGDWDRAEEHFQEARSLNEALGATTWLAHTHVEHARMLLARREGGDRESAAEHLRQALALAERHGLQAVSARAAALGGTTGPTRVPPDGLTPREVELLSLLALGLSNRELGGRLHISEHTAANHVRSILRKTGCANRTEATTYAHRHGLVPVA